MSLHIAPPSNHASSTQPGPSAPSAPGLYDTLRASSATASLATNAPATPAALQTATTPTPISSAHPLEARLANWSATQQSMQHALLRRQFGMAAPIIRGMELQDCALSTALRPSALDGVYGHARGRGVHEDVLLGRDASIEWEDVWTGDLMSGWEGYGDVHGEMERRRGMVGW